MTARWEITIDRVVVNGVTGPAPAAAELQPLIEAAVGAAVAEAGLPAGRAVRASVQLRATSLGSPAAIARAVGHGVSQAVKGVRSHG